MDIWAFLIGAIGKGVSKRCFLGKIEWGGFRRGGVSHSRFVLKLDVAIATEVSVFSKSSLAIADFHAKKTQHIQLSENPLPGTPPFAIPSFLLIRGPQMGGQICRRRIWRFWGPNFQSREVPQNQFLKGFGASDGKIGAPQKRQILPPRI